MRIILICEGFHYIGGVGSFVDNLATHLKRLGHDALVVSYLRPEREQVSRATKEFLYLNVPPYKPPTWRHLERLVRAPRSTLELINCIRRWRPDVVNNHGGKWDRFPTIVNACKAARVPLVQSLHAVNYRGTLGEKPLHALNDAAALIAVSAATRDQFAAMLPAARDAYVINDGVDCEAADKAEPCRRARPYIFCACRLDLRYKAIDLLLETFATLAAEYPNVGLLIAGEGPDRERLAELIAAKGLANRVELLGPKDPAELWSYYKGALLFAMPSRVAEGASGWREGQPLVFLEAMASGIPVIGTDTGGSSEVVLEGRTGFLVAPDRPEELARAIRKLLDEPQLRSEMGRQARALAAQHDWPDIARRYLEVYASSVASRSAARA